MNSLKAGDTIVFEKNIMNEINIYFQKENETGTNDIDFIILSGNWKVIRI